MSTVSVVLAVYNEEDNLKRCLNSVKNMADEIVIVDGGSKDRTLKVAESFNAKIIQAKNNPQNFHVNKNIAIDAASKDWILQLDADEVISDELVQEIKQAVTSTKINGYWLPRKNFFLGRFLTKGGQYPDYTLRLYRNGTGRLPGKDVHEQAIVEGKVGYLKNDLLHLKDKNFAIYLSRFNKYTDLLATQHYQAHLTINAMSFISYIFLKPIMWFVKSYIRHRGYVDGFPGFIFSLFSSLRFPVAYLKLWEKNRRGL